MATAGLCRQHLIVHPARHRPQCPPPSGRDDRDAEAGRNSDMATVDLLTRCCRSANVALPSAAAGRKEHRDSAKSPTPSGRSCALCPLRPATRRMPERNRTVSDTRRATLRASINKAYNYNKSIVERGNALPAQAAAPRADRVRRHGSSTTDARPRASNNCRAEARIVWRTAGWGRLRSRHAHTAAYALGRAPNHRSTSERNQPIAREFGPPEPDWRWKVAGSNSSP